MRPSVALDLKRSIIRETTSRFRVTVHRDGVDSTNSSGNG